MKETKENYKVYMHIFPNNKKYIGITRTKLNYRWQNGKGYKNQIVGRAIEKYGWDNIEHQVLFDNLEKETAERLEMTCIALFKSNNFDYGYNIDNGGNGSNKKSDDEKKRMSEYRKGRQCGKDNPFSKYVICVVTNEVFECIADASRKYKVDHTNLSRACKTGMACGDINGAKLYWAYCDENGNYEFVKRKKYERKVKCITTELEFDSIKKASDYYNINYDCIWCCCNGKSKSGGKLNDGTKLVWEYID